MGSANSRFGSFKGWSRLVGLCGLLAASSACGPYLKDVRISSQQFQSTAECAQGPFSIHMIASGARWGERFRVELDSQHAIQGAYELVVDGKVRQSGGFRSQLITTTTDGYGSPVSRSVDDTHADNARCLARPPPAAIEVRPPLGALPTGAIPMPPPAPGEAIPMAPEPLEPAQPPAKLVELPSGSARLHVAHRTQVFEISSTNDDPEQERGPFEPGADLELRFWFEEPNDLVNARVVVTHDDIIPTDEAAWIAKLEDEKLERQRDDERRRQEYERERQEQEKRITWCNAHHEDEDCWGEAGFDAEMKRREQARAEALAADAKWRKEHPSEPAQAKAPPRKQVDPVPPPARVESPPPRPSPHAEWVSGYWHRTDEGWIWLEGWWRVPDSDRRANLTATAPSAPPVARMETRPMQVVGAVWIPGSWFWSGAAWVWYPGHWSLPPAAGANWVPARWIPGSVGVRLEPGRWMLRAR